MSAPDSFDDPPDLRDLARDLASDVCDPYSFAYRDKTFTERVANCGKLARFAWRHGRSTYNRANCGSFRHDSCATWRIDGVRKNGERNPRSLRALYDASPPFDGLDVVYVQPFPHDPLQDDPRSLDRIGQRARDRGRKSGVPIEWSQAQAWLPDDGGSVAFFFSTADLSTSRDRWPPRRVHPDVAREWYFDEILRPGVLAEMPSCSDGCPWGLPPAPKKEKVTGKKPGPRLGMADYHLAAQVSERHEEYVDHERALLYASGKWSIDHEEESEIVERTYARAVAEILAEDEDRRRRKEQERNERESC